ncbi:hypothetical protein ACFRCG_17360 [Embleya sp. NPDC056575]|uniref:hypothetical protein n=1 Tax=unclassified Embleya TaxID=2699296 RepID=UPI0036CF1E0B
MKKKTAVRASFVLASAVAGLVAFSGAAHATSTVAPSYNNSSNGVSLPYVPGARYSATNPGTAGEYTTLPDWAVARLSVYP